MHAQEISAQIAATRDPIIRSVLLQMAERQREAGAAFARLRAARGLTQSELATAADVAYRTIQAWEAGDVLHPRPSNVRKVAAALSMEAGDLRTVLMPVRNTQLPDVLIQRIEALEREVRDLRGEPSNPGVPSNSATRP